MSEKETYMIDMHAPRETLMKQLDVLWVLVYTKEPIEDFHADEDGKIFFTAPAL